MRFPLALVDRVEENEVVATASPPNARKKVRQPTTPNTDAAAGGATDAAKPEEPSAPEIPRRTVRYSNEIDHISFEIPETWELHQRQEQEGEESGRYAFMNPANLLRGEEDEGRYDLLVGLRTVNASVSRAREDHAISWLSRVRTGFLVGPMEVRKTAQTGLRTIGERTHYVSRYWHEWDSSESRQDGIFLLYFPDDFEEANRYYIFQYFVTFGTDDDTVELDLGELDAVVDSFRIRRLR